MIYRSVFEYLGGRRETLLLLNLSTSPSKDEDLKFDSLVASLEAIPVAEFRGTRGGWA